MYAQAFNFAYSWRLGFLVVPYALKVTQIQSYKLRFSGFGEITSPLNPVLNSYNGSSNKEQLRPRSKEPL